jgi:hypothetical protein
MDRFALDVVSLWRIADMAAVASRDGTVRSGFCQVGLIDRWDQHGQQKRAGYTVCTPPLGCAFSGMESVMTVNRQSSMSVRVVLGHLRGSFTEGENSVTGEFCA